MLLVRGSQKRSQFVLVNYRGRRVIFWQTPKAARAARPGLRIPGGEAPETLFYRDTRERYGYTFSTHGAKVERRALPVGDYAVMNGGRMLCVVERKSRDDFTAALVDGTLGFALIELSAYHWQPWSSNADIGDPSTFVCPTRIRATAGRAASDALPERPNRIP